jgi:hypothetical protein
MLEAAHEGSRLSNLCDRKRHNAPGSSMPRRIGATVHTFPTPARQEKPFSNRSSGLAFRPTLRAGSSNRPKRSIDDIAGQAGKRRIFVSSERPENGKFPRDMGASPRRYNSR